jgi:hypothetical protein
MLFKKEYNSFYQPYIDKVNLEKSIENNLQVSLSELLNILGNLSNRQSEFRYASNKWSIKELVQHLIDTERILSYRALAISRKDKNKLPGFNENEYILNSNSDSIKLTNLLKEFSLIRKANITMFKNFNEKKLLQTGIADNSQISVRAIGYIMSGHVFHHLKVLKERYLS